MAPSRLGRASRIGIVALTIAVLAGPALAQDAGVAARLAAAESAALSGRWSTAEALYSQILTEDRSVIDAHLGLANVLTAQGRYDEAVAAYEATIRQAPRDPVPRYNLAALLDARRSRSALGAWSSYIAVAAELPEERGFVAKARLRVRRLQGR